MPVREPVDLRGHRRVDRRGQRVDVAVLAERAQHLVEEQRTARRTLGEHANVARQQRRVLGRADHGLDRFVLGERRELDRGRRVRRRRRRTRSRPGAGSHTAAPTAARARPSGAAGRPTARPCGARPRTRARRARKDVGARNAAVTSSTRCRRNSGSRHRGLGRVGRGRGRAASRASGSSLSELGRDGRSTTSRSRRATSSRCSFSSTPSR